mmetsp:Transcript_33760/g.67310  ORF Transcript_33760/g.67310 Transcript_33760/m.67310 type:complete len:342 (-) Transcript_33760:169-1194(-)
MPLVLMPHVKKRMTKNLLGRSSELHNARVATQKILNRGKKMLDRGNFQEAEKEVLRAVAIDPQNSDDSKGTLRPVVYYALACVQARRGDATMALDSLTASVNLGWKDSSWFANDPDLASVRFDERFTSLLARMKGTGTTPVNSQAATAEVVKNAPAQVAPMADVSAITVEGELVTSGMQGETTGAIPANNQAAEKPFSLIAVVDQEQLEAAQVATKQHLDASKQALARGELDDAQACVCKAYAIDPQNCHPDCRDLRIEVYYQMACVQVQRKQDTGWDVQALSLLKTAVDMGLSDYTRMAKDWAHTGVQKDEHFKILLARVQEKERFLHGGGGCASACAIA